MKSKETNRNYKMIARAESAALNERKIMDATAKLWLELPIKGITLEKVAERSGVTVRTILRKFGSKEGLFEACMENDLESPVAERFNAKPGDLDSILHALLAEYEDMGEAAIRTIFIQNELPIAKKILETGRSEHRRWCAEMFKPYLPDPSTSSEYEVRLLAFITATEVYLWKLLRRDLNKSYEETYKVFQTLLEGLIQKFQINQIKLS